eukprot:158735_1
MAYNASKMSRRNPYHYSASEYDANNYDKILWNTGSASNLMNSMPLINSYSSNYDNGFLSHLNAIRKLITWLENESDIFDKSLLNEAKFNRIKNEMTTIQNCITNGLKDCNDLIEKNKISYNNYSKYKARYQNVRLQFTTIDKQIKRSMHKLNRKFAQKKAKKSLLQNAHNTSQMNAQMDEYEHLKSSLGLIDDTLEMIRNVKSDMFHQSNLLRGAKKNLLKLINLTGFSSSIIRVISQRSQMDFYIFIIGCVLTLTIIFALVYYF